MKYNGMIHTYATDVAKDKSTIYKKEKGAGTEYECKDCKHFDPSIVGAKGSSSCTIFECFVPADDHICGVFRPIKQSHKG